ncbi:autotransporter passenger strand-loop-strand repeat protein, partial [Bartonella silvatica]
MRCKHKLGFSVLMMSSCLVQVISAAESRSLTELESIKSGGTIPKGSALVLSTLIPTRNITIGGGSVEVVDHGRTSIGATIQKDGMQIVTRGGTAIETKIRGGKQLVYEEKNLDLTKVPKLSSAYDATVNGDNSGAVGQQNVYDGAWAWNTKVGKDGEQNLYMGSRHDGGVSMYTEVSDNGRQHVLAGGISRGTILKGEATQVVYPEGLLDTLTIGDSASSWLHVGAKDTIGDVRVNGGGKLYLFAGDITDHITKEKISIEGRVDETIFLVGERSTRERLEINIEDLGGQGGTIIFNSIPYDPHHISLHVERLSGDLHFRFNISASGDRSDYLSIDEGAGNHKVSVTDSGSEITSSLSQGNSLATEINLIMERIGGANFTLTDYSGQSIEAVDGGAYMYRLYKRERTTDFGGDYTVWYLGISTEGPERSSSSLPRTKSKPKTTVFSSSSSSEASSSSRRGSSSSQGRGTNARNTSGRQNNKPVSKPRPPRHLRGDQQVSVSSPSVLPVQQISHQDGNHP